LLLLFGASMVKVPVPEGFDSIAILVMRYPSTHS